METVVVRITARSGMEDKVEAFYLNQQAEYEAASGFLGRTILKARTGAMLKSIQSRMSAEQMAKHPAPEVDEEPGTEFVLIERWESVESRLNFTMSRSRERDKDLFPTFYRSIHQEYFEDVTG